MAPLPSNLKGALLGLAAMGLFACADVTIKFLGGGYNAFQIIFFAGLMSIPLLAGMAMLDPAAASMRPVRPGLMALRCVVVVINGILGTYAFSVLPLAQCYVIFFTMPIFITLLLALILGERIDLPRGVAVVVGLIGVIVALDPVGTTLQWGHAAAILGAIFGAGNAVIIRMSGRVERTVVMILYPTMLQLAVAALVLPLVYVPMSFLDLSLTALMAVAAFAGYLLIIEAYRRAPGIVVAPMQYSQIIWAAILGALLFNEVMSGQTVIGVILIIAAGVVIVARQDRAA
ncbi:MAG: DMT family transporter [Paracoccaceae bacterium]